MKSSDYISMGIACDENTANNRSYFLPKAALLSVSFSVITAIVPSPAGAYTIPKIQNISQPCGIVSNQLIERRGIKCSTADYNGSTIMLEGALMFSSKLNENLQKLDSFHELAYDWNGNGASPLSNSLYSLCEELLCGAIVQPQIFPTARDTIQLDYENDNGDYMSFEIYPDRTVKVFNFMSDGNTFTQYQKFDMSALNGLVKRFYGSVTE